MKFLPYTTQKGYRDGVVISFIDVSDFIHSQHELRISEGRFKKVIETGFDAFYLLKPKTDESGEMIDFIIADMNKKAEEQMSMSREQLLGKGICELFPVNINNGYFQIYKNVAKTGTPFEQEYQISDEFAAPGWFYQQVVPEEDGVMIFNRDISARKQMELDLQQTTNLYQSLFKNMTKGFALHQIITDALGNPVDYRFIDVNQHFEIITGLKRDEILGRTILELLPNIEKIWIEKYGKVALSGEHLIFEQESKILQKTFRVNAYSPIHGQFATLFEEI
jgi:PAS domain S-box-containing protein